MKAPRRTAGLPPHPNTASRPVQSCVRSAQVSPASFKPDMEKQVTATATVGVNPNAPAVRKQSAGPPDPVVPYSGSPVSYSPFGFAGGTF